MANNYPTKGLVTFEAEGNNNPKSIHFSRVAHVPSNSSGVTIGRGYDMKKRTKTKIITDLVNAGISKKESGLLAEGAGLSGTSAKTFIKKKEIKSIVISEEAQLKLFETIYEEYEKNAKRICTKADVTEKYGTCKWNSYSMELQELVTDLLYRGDYNPNSRTYLQKAIISNDPDKIKKALRKIPDVPPDRAKRREELLDRWKMKKNKSPKIFLPTTDEKIDIFQKHQF